MAKRHRRRRKAQGKGDVEGGDDQLTLLNTAARTGNPETPEEDVGKQEDAEQPFEPPAESLLAPATPTAPGPEPQAPEASHRWRSTEPEPPVEELLANGEYARALPQIEISLDESPGDVELLLTAAKAYGMAGEYPRARACLDRALEARPDDLRIQREIGFALFRRGLYEESAEALSVVCARSEHDGDAYYYRGEALNRSGRAEEAAKAMERAVRLSPADVRALRSLGRIYDKIGNAEKAADAYSRARKAAHTGSAPNL